MHGSQPVSTTRRSYGVLSSVDGRTHQVDELVLTTVLGHGISALCGRYILAASLTDPPGPPCPLCTAVVTLGGRARRI